MSLPHTVQPTPDRAVARHPAWLPPEAFGPLGIRSALVCGTGPLVDTVVEELTRAGTRYGGRVHRHARAGAVELVLALTGADPLPPVAARLAGEVAGTLGAEGFLLDRSGHVPVLLADTPAGLLYGLFHLVRLGGSAFDLHPVERHRPALDRRMLDHWDNVDVHPVMGQVERGYAGGSIFWRDGAARNEPDRIREYGRLLAACGVNAITVNNVNVHATEARLLTDRLGDVAAIADLLRPYAVRVHLSVTFAAPVVLGGLPTADPLDDRVRAWWATATRQVYDRIPDFGGYVVKADSEGQPGPFTYGRDHADGANLLAGALAPFGGVVHWRAFVYNHRQDWRDRTTDRARAAYDHFAPLDGRFRDNVIVQVKHGPIDFQAREPVSPVLAAMPATRLAVEVQVTQEYTGQQRHVCYLGPWWSELLGFTPWGPQGRTVADIAAGAGRTGTGAGGGRTGTGAGAGRTDTGAAGGRTLPGGGLVGVANVGADPFWTGHPLAQANLYAFGRLGWDPRLDPRAVLDEWIGLTFPPSTTGDPALVRRTLHEIMDDSWRTYERYTAPLGVGFMVNPRDHYGPGVDGYEYSPWGTYHFADRDGVGVDRTRATGTGFTGQYPCPWAERYESVEQCPDELLLFFHHVPYDHVLRSGSTVIQHIYDTHFAGVEQVKTMRQRWQRLAGLVDAAVHARVSGLLEEQLRCAREWRDQINTYFFRKSGVPDTHSRPIH
ncbi:alpha-glucuronidase [Micromonospora cathayae]|uniref:Alpha-glucuronidase n=1 Tax=Micromonospora cathayae TaxID=3028804 RepID=A0ABY7ZKS6_9ACTN|nr:alpha-glucuronidase [Micromonospora sp. HUAS 3]WDZ83520.1 alpha-glucuronidase [Micromonospora sp. HUAS 3]